MAKHFYQTINKAVSLAALLIVFLALSCPAWAEQTDRIILPPGQLSGIYSAAFVNQELIDQGRATPTTLPFEQGTNVYEVKTTATTYFVRFYKYDDSRMRGGGVGGWIMPADSVRGLTASQVRDKFALPTLPDYFIAVRVPVGVTLRTGAAGEIDGWGQGGGQQILLMEYIPLSGYKADRPIIGAALSYGPYVTSGNAGAMAAYLDSLATPVRYSDLDIVMANLNLQETASLAQSMRTLSPEVYDSLTEITMQQGLMALDSMAAHRREMSLSKAAEQVREGVVVPWAKFLGAAGDVEDSGERTGFGYDSAGVSGGCDWFYSQNLLLGVNLFYSRTAFDWAQGKGDGDAEHLNLGFEAMYDEQGWFVEGSALTGLRSADTKRRIRFEDLNRIAGGSPDGQCFAGRIGAGLKYQLLGWSMRPGVNLNIIHSRQEGFTETGADGLNLKVDSLDATTLIGRMELLCSRVITCDSGLIWRPELTFAYQHNSPMDDRDISASLAGQGGSFTVHGDDEARDVFAPSLEISAKTQGGVTVYGRYEGQFAGSYTQQTLSAGAAIDF